MSDLRWHDCDKMPDPVARLDCRTSKLNDGFHRLESQVTKLNRKVSAGLLMQACAGLGGIAALVNALHSAGLL